MRWGRPGGRRRQAVVASSVALFVTSEAASSRFCWPPVAQRHLARLARSEPWKVTATTFFQRQEALPLGTSGHQVHRADEGFEHSEFVQDRKSVV